MHTISLIHAVRVMQATGNHNFYIAITIDSRLVPDNKGTKEALIVTSETKHFITFGLAACGTNVHLRSETVASGSATVVLDLSTLANIGAL
jgi:hypothetical protein